MESMEIGMMWTASAEVLKDSCSSSPAAPDQEPHHLSITENVQLGSPITANEAEMVDEIPSTALNVEIDEETTGAGSCAQGAKSDGLKGLEEKETPRSKKRKTTSGETDDTLDRFGPPRQSVRARIKMEFHSSPERLKETMPSTSKKIKKGEQISASMTTGPCSESERKKSRKELQKEKKEKEDRKNKKDKKDQEKRQPQATTSDMVNGTNKPISPDVHPSMVLTEEDIDSDEIVAYQPGSMEAMFTSKVETIKKEDTLDQRLQAKKRRNRKTAIPKTKEESDTDIPWVEIGSTEDPGPVPLERGIRSSTFARVMRLVADLPRVEAKPMKVKRREPEHRPSVWAMSRQELCEALPYYRAFQSGLYLSQGVAFGYLLDGFPAPRDACAHNARVIISHGGGHCVRPTLDDGQVLPPVLAGDQLVTDFRIAALVRAWQRRVPLVLIAGLGYELLPFKLNCSYAVLGWYWVSKVWTEAESVAQGIKPPSGRNWFKRVKVRFDWVQSQGTPWWEQPAAPTPNQTHPHPGSATYPQAEDIKMSELALPLPDQNHMETLAQLRSAQCAGPPLVPLDPKSGLLTPPITPPTLHSHTLSTTALSHSSAIGTVALNQPKARRLPGNYLLTAMIGSVDVTSSSESFTALRRECQYCHKTSVTVYSEGWMCLTNQCIAYWMLNTNIGLLPIPPGFKLSYLPDFLEPPPTPRDIRPPYDATPSRPEGGIPDEAGPGDSAGSRSLWRGWVCEGCGRANCRFRWEVWQCLGCQKLLAPIDPYSPAIPARALSDPETAILGDARIDPNSRISVAMRRIQYPAATVMVYTLPDSIGTIYHVVNDCNEFADGIFNRYQREAASTRVPLFQRRPLNAHQIRGQLLAQHFAVNSGVSYKYNVDSLSLSFDDSPSCVIQALDAITLRTERVVGTKVDFNEVLSVLYREGQKMSWHDDGEPGLGPVVAGLSLGSSATISWRRKSAHSNANAAFNKGMPDPRKEATPPIALSLTTSHGDIVMMEGRDMQKKYVHRVIPSGFRVAATARVIGK